MCSCVPCSCVPSLCARVCAPVDVSFRLGSLFRLPACALQSGNLPLHPNPQLPQPGKVGSGVGICGRRESLHLRGPSTHPAPPSPRLQPLPGSCSTASTSSPQVCQLPTRLQDPDSGRPPGRARPGVGGGAAEAAPPTQGGEWSAQHPLHSRPYAQPCLRSIVAQGCPSALRFNSLLDLAFDLEKGPVARDRELSYLAALTKLAVRLYCHLSFSVGCQTWSTLSPLPQTRGKPQGSRQRRLEFHQNRLLLSSNTP